MFLPSIVISDVYHNVMQHLTIEVECHSWYEYCMTHQCGAPSRRLVTAFTNVMLKLLLLDVSEVLLLVVQGCEFASILLSLNAVWIFTYMYQALALFSQIGNRSIKMLMFHIG